MKEEKEQVEEDKVEEDKQNADDMDFGAAEAEDANQNDEMRNHIE